MPGELAPDSRNVKKAMVSPAVQIRQAIIVDIALLAPGI